ncbi:elongation factor G, mitochondrial-like [Manduca sexta]|uniref:elongation factor G, mitochondrial-like n=1 Tax=Manduca sexta TaxID=7130 RepID=UPI00188EEC75|nr:elongation factor G, mitochondrial-like [Manduca sexta]
MYFDGDYGEIVRLDEVPQDRRAEVQERRHELIEHLSNVDEHLGELFLEEKTPTVEDIKQAIRRNTLKRTLHQYF